jgi:hypothetical protein
MGWWSEHVTDPISDVWSGITGETAGEAAKEAAGVSAGAQMQQLDYLKEINKLPQELREQALTKYGSLFGIGPEGEAVDAMGAQQALIEQAQASPYYQAIMGGQKAGEEAILRHAARTGGLRSGNVQSALYDYNVNLKNKALADAYQQQMTGLTGLAQLPTGTEQIGQTMANIGTTQAAGITGQAQAEMMGLQNLLGIGSQLGSAAMLGGTI